MEFGFARFFLGLGESGNFPAAIKTVAEWFPQNERSLATGIFNSGANVGAILAPAIVPWVTLRYGWHAAFLITGLFSVLWILWWFRNYRKPTDHPTSDERPNCGTSTRESADGHGPHRALAPTAGLPPDLGLFDREVPYRSDLVVLSCSGCRLTSALKFNLNLSHLGLPLIIVYNVSAIGSIGGGWLPAPFRRLGLSPNYARLAAMLFCACVVVPIFTATRLQSEWAAIALLSLAAGAHQGWSANLFTTSSDMFPRSAVGSVVGIGGMAGSVGGALFAFFAGHILQLTHSYTHPLRHRGQRVPPGAGSFCTCSLPD